MQISRNNFAHAFIELKKLKLTCTTNYRNLQMEIDKGCLKLCKNDKF